eukprot:gene3257-6444_t
MSSKKRIRRENEVADEHAKHIRLSVDEALIASKPNNDMFIVDRVGSKTTKRKFVQEAVVKANGLSKSSAENVLVAKVVAGKVLATRKRFQVKDNKNEGNNIVDIWSDNDPPIKSNRITVNKKLKVALPGLSYNPSLDDHQDVIAEAIALQIKKEEKDAKTKGPIEYNPIESHNIYEIEQDESSSDEDVDTNNDTTTAFRMKQKVKLTKAQRNKIRNRKEKEFKVLQNNINKNILKSIDTIPKIIKDITTIELQAESKAMLRKAQDESRNDTSAMTYEDAGSVPLSDELLGSLRCLRPKGNIIKDQVSKMRISKDMMDVDRRKRTKYEKPHGGKRIKWVAKYKYTT